MSQESSNLSPEDEKKFKEWSQGEYVKINKFCQSKGYQVRGIDQSKCQTLPPALGVWYVHTTEKGLDLWVIAGEFPTDIAKSDIAKNAREVLRHFSMSWHMQAASIENRLSSGQVPESEKDTQSKFAADLTKRAEDLYELFAADQLWANTGL